MQLILITPDTTQGNEADLVNDMFAAGLPRLHLRKPGAFFEDYRHYLDVIDTQYHDRIALCDCFDLLDEFSLGGIHLNSTMRKDQLIWMKIRQFASAGISTSYHSWDEVAASTFPYDYVLVSPVFDSISKEGYKAAIDLSGITDIKSRLTEQNHPVPPIIGLGGVGSSQIGELHHYGFDGAAVLGAVWQSGDPVENFKKIMAAVNAL